MPYVFTSIHTRPWLNHLLRQVFEPVIIGVFFGNAYATLIAVNFDLLLKKRVFIHIQPIAYKID